MVVAVAVFAVVLKAGLGVGARADLVEVVFWRSGDSSATAVVQVVLSAVAAARPGLDVNARSGSLALPETVVELDGRVRYLDPFLATVDAESGSDGFFWCVFR